VRKKLLSEKKVVSAPFSFIGSARRIWKITGSSLLSKIIMFLPALALILLAWFFVLNWYILFSIFVIPYRLIRRGQRKREREYVRYLEQRSEKLRQLEQRSRPASGERKEPQRSVGRSLPRSLFWAFLFAVVVLVLVLLIVG
jgi:ABC-type sugar transport system permease subunit